MNESMEERVRDLEVSSAKQEVHVQFLVKVVEDNTRAINDLTTILNKAKGAGALANGMYILLSGAAGAGLVSWLKG